MPRDPSEFRAVEEIVNKAIADEGLVLLGWRDVPVDNSDLGQSVKATEPVQRQIFVGRPKTVADEDTFERRLFIARKVISNAVFALTTRGSCGITTRSACPAALSSTRAWCW